MQIQRIDGSTIDDLHFKLLRSIFQNGNIYVIEKGSYQGHKRLEFDFVTSRISNPGIRPLSIQVPQGVVPPTNDETIEEYFVNYLMDTELTENEEYKYSTYIVPQVNKIIEMYQDGNFQTNHAVITVGNENSIDSEDPPCLKLINFRVQNKKLNMFVYFRSNDLWGGFPTNIGGLQLLKEYVAASTCLEDGEILYSSIGLHLYDFQWPIALARLNGVIPENSVISKEEVSLGEGWKNLPS